LTLRIKRNSEDGGTRLCLSGELRSSNLDDLRNEVMKPSQQVVLDLTEIGLVDIDGVRWLNACQIVGIQIDNCPPYIREWMLQERA
jgi:ABC-type transporter Mla MlaB component